MISRLKALICAVSAVAAMALATDRAAAQSGAPIKIGFSMAMTGGLAANGRSALLAQKIWEEDVNAKGGLLGRPVKLIYYDDQSNPATVPGIYTKLLDIDKVDLLIGPYATAQIAPAMPIVIQRNKLFIALLGLAVNSEFDYPNYFVMIPSGPDPKPAFTKGFFDIAMAQAPKPRTVAIVAADQEFSRNGSDGARENAKKAGLRIVYDKTYPPSTTDFAPIVRAVAAINPDLLVICSYPPDSVGLVRSINEIGFKPKMVGGGMVGLQATALKAQLGAALNGFVNFDFWLPVPKIDFPGIDTLLQKYQARAQAEGVDALATTWRRGATRNSRSWRRRSRRRRASTTRSSPTSSAPIRSRPCSATSSSARAASGRSRGCCRCSSTTSRATTSSSSVPWERRRCSPRRSTSRAV
jgi:branched-chain amino acid transport system substrate-binding protein